MPQVQRLKFSPCSKAQCFSEAEPNWLERGSQPPGFSLTSQLAKLKKPSRTALMPANTGAELTLPDKMDKKPQLLSTCHGVL